MNIPVIAICDTNTNPSNVDYPIPGNDDALRAISLYCDLIAASVLKGLETNLEESGVDIGETKDLAEEKIIDDFSNEDNVHEVIVSEGTENNENINLSSSTKEVESEDIPIKND